MLNTLNYVIWTDENRNTDLALGDNPGTILDQYLSREELEELILEEGNVFDNDLPRTSRIDVFDDFQLKRTLKMFWNISKCILQCHLQPLECIKKMQQ